MKHCYKILCLLVVLGLFIELFHPSSSSSLDAKITDFVVTQNTKDVLVSFSVKDCFTKKMEEAILAGIATSFTFLIELRQQGTFWDSTITSLEIRHTIKYDNVRNTYYVSYSEEGGVPVEFRDLDSAKRAMVDLNGIAIVPFNTLKRDRQYYIKAKAKLAKVRMPLRMEHVLFFVSLWDFETDWYRQEVANQ